MQGDVVGAVAVGILALHVVVLGGLWVVRRPQRGVLLLAALAPFDGVLLIVPHPGLVEGWKEGLVLATVAAALLAPAPHRRPLPGWVPALTGLVLVGLVSAVVVGGVQGLLGLKIDFFYLLLLPALWRCPFTRGDRDRLVTVLMTTGAVASVVGLAQQVVGQEALNQLGYEYNTTIRTADGLLRSFSTFNQPFPFGLYVMLVLLVGLPVALGDPGRRRNRLFLALVPVLVLGMLSSIVRAAIAGLAVGFVFLWWHRHRVLAHAVPPGLAALLFVPPAVAAPLLSPSSLGQRTSGWTATFSQVLAAPFGSGIGASGSAAEKASQVSGTADTSYQPDNYYFKTLFELGPVGLWLLLLLLVAAFLWARGLSLALRRASADAPPRDGRGDEDLAAGIAASVLAAMTASLVATYFEIFPLDLFFWLLLGVLTSLQAGSPSTPSPSAPAAAVSRPTSVSSSVR
ncbi:MAG: hypothetical protein JWM64_1130 [Frankiales bacterium]|nr:hypothetical protein [Frankiales bacterium]